MPSSNPALRGIDKKIGRETAGATPSAAYLQQMYDRPDAPPQARPRPLTLDDVIAKTATVLGVAVVAGVLAAYFQVGGGVIIGAVVAGLVLSMVAIFKRSTNPALILSYSAVEGIALGGISGWFNVVYPGIALQAIVGTLGVFCGMLLVYKTGAIRVTPRFTKMLIGAMVGAVMLMVFNLLGSMLFGLNPLRGGNPTFSIIFSIVCIAIAALSFLVDFDQIDKALKIGVPSRYAWYFAFGLMLTLVWLYLEILRLLAYMRN